MLFTKQAGVYILLQSGLVYMLIMMGLLLFLMEGGFWLQIVRMDLGGNALEGMLPSSWSNFRQARVHLQGMHVRCLAVTPTIARCNACSWARHILLHSKESLQRLSLAASFCALTKYVISAELCRWNCSYMRTGTNGLHQMFSRTGASASEGL